ncbi:hypothetical protein KXV85_005467, partial [Aspergillus fumigatus]
GVLHQAARPRPDRGFPSGLHCRAGADASRLCNTAGLHPRRDGAACDGLAQHRRACRARAGQRDVLDHRGLFRLALAACARRGELVRAGLSGLRDCRRRRRQPRSMGRRARAARRVLPPLGGTGRHRAVRRADLAGQHRHA